MERGTNKYTSTHGFSLVELAVVTVIISLIVAGILVGKDLIDAAKIRATVEQLGKYETAANTFRNKYNAIPGDIRKAVQYNLGETGGPGDNGNGDSLLTSDIQNDENINFWYHLFRAGLVEGAYNGTNITFGEGAPKTDLRNVGVYVGSATQIGFGNIFVVGMDDDDPDVFILTPAEAFTIDVKMDDGMPAGGKVVEVQPAVTGCVNYSVTPPEYNVSTDTFRCVNFIRTQF
jgi:prepilin-type N-terminal cleavage/methylation domain-containing protein